MVNRAEGIELDVKREGLRFRKVPTARLSKRQFDDIQDLRYRHYVGQLVDRPSDEARTRDTAQVGHFVGQTTLSSLRNLNTLVGHGRRRYQRYARQMMVLVTDDDDELRAGFRYEDNARSRILQNIEKSGGTPDVVDKAKGALEIAGKLYVPHPKLIEGRHGVFEEVIYDPSMPGLQFVAAGVAAEDFRDDQPGAAYPFREEIGFRQDLRLMGFRPDPGEPFATNAFGSYVPEAFTERWAAKRMDDVRANIHAIPGVSAAIEQAFATIR